jgi:hypothetical protein
MAPMTGLGHPDLQLTSQKILEVAALTPCSPQTGAVLLDIALEASLATQAGLLLSLPLCMQIATTAPHAVATLVGL